MSNGKENDMLLDYYQSHSLPKFCIPRMRSINVLTRLTRLRWAFLTSLVDTRSRVQELSREGTPDSGALGRPPSGWFPASPRQRVPANKRTLGPAHPTGDQDISTDLPEFPIRFWMAIGFGLALHPCINKDGRTISPFVSAVLHGSNSCSIPPVQYIFSAPPDTPSRYTKVVIVPPSRLKKKNRN